MIIEIARIKLMVRTDLQQNNEPNADAYIIVYMFGMGLQLRKATISRTVQHHDVPSVVGFLTSHQRKWREISLAALLHVWTLDVHRFE